MARGLVARKLVALGGQPELRENFTTDNGNLILDVHNMDLVDAAGMERNINNIPGVVCSAAVYLLYAMPTPCWFPAKTELNGIELPYKYATA